MRQIGYIRQLDRAVSNRYNKLSEVTVVSIYLSKTND